MNIYKSFSEQKLSWLGIAFLFLAVVVVFINLLPSAKKPGAALKPTKQPTAPALANEKNESIFARLEFQKAHQDFQRSYLNLINKISQTDTEHINTADAPKIYVGYNYVREKYTDVKKSFDDYEKGYKLKCFAQMRKLILAVLYHDRKKKKRMTKFDPKVLIEMGAIKEIPTCPRGGSYSIVYKAGRRLFRCSVHGILKN